MRQHEPYQKLKGKLRELNLSYESVAQDLEIAKVSVANKINGKSDFSVGELVVLNEKYQIGLDIFLPTKCQI